MIARELIQMVRRLCEVTEAEVLAARSLENALLRELHEKRVDMLFDLTVAMAVPITAGDPDQVELFREFKKLQRAEKRLSMVAGVVVDALSAMAGGSASRVYGRSGQLQE